MRARYFLTLDWNSSDLMVSSNCSFESFWFDRADQASIECDIRSMWALDPLAKDGEILFKFCLLAGFPFMD